MSEARLIAGPATLSNAALVLLIPVGLGAALIADQNASGSERLAWLGVGVVAQVAMTLVLLAARVLRAGRYRPATILAVVLAAAARAVTIALLITRVESGDPLPATQRLTAGTVTFTAWTLLIGAVLQSWVNYRQHLRDMLMRVDATWLEAEAFNSSWRQRLNEAAADPTRLATEAESLHRDIEQRLRPLSHRLWFGVTNRQSRGQLVSQMLTEPLPLRWIALLGCGLLVWNASYRLGVPLAALAGLVATLMTISVLALGERLAPRNRLVRTLSILAATTAIAFVGYLIVGGADIAGVLVMASGELTIIVGAQIIAVSVRQRRDTVSDLASRVDALDSERRAVAAHLHSTVQARWTATAMRVRRAARSGDAAELDRALAEVEDTLALPQAATDSLAALARAWEGIAAIRLSVETGIAASQAQTLGQLVEEAVANAIRHGKARNIEILVTAGAGTIDIVVSDDGLGMESGSRPGLGSRWLDSVSQWERSSDSQGTTLRASLPVN